MADKLTPKQERFAQLIAGGNDQSTAYREAFNSNGKDSTVHSEASRLMKNPKVTARVDQITEQKHRAISRKAVTDRELVVGKLRRWTEDGIDPTTGDEPTQAQLTAAQLLGRTVALFSDMLEQVTTERTADEVAAEIKRRLAVAAESEQDGEPLH